MAWQSRPSLTVLDLPRPNIHAVEHARQETGLCLALGPYAPPCAQRGEASLAPRDYARPPLAVTEHQQIGLQ